MLACFGHCLASVACYIYIVPYLVNSLWPSDTIWWQRTGSTVAKVMAWCLMAPSHYLNQCWLTSREAHWHAPDGNFRRKYWRYQSIKGVLKLYTWNSNLEGHFKNTHELLNKRALKFSPANEIHISSNVPTRDTDDVGCSRHHQS